MEETANFDLIPTRFPRFSAEEKQKILDERLSANTRKSTEVHMRNFAQWLEENFHPKPEEISTEELPDLLFDFYSETVRKDGGIFKVNTLKNLRSGLNRFYKEDRSIDIVNDTRFTRANEMFCGIKVQAKKKRGRAQQICIQQLFQRTCKQFLSGLNMITKLIQTPRSSSKMSSSM